MKNRFYQFETFPLHVSGKCGYENWPAASAEQLWHIFCHVINSLQEDHRLITHAFVMMNSHYHWLCTYEQWSQDHGLFDWFHKAINFEYFRTLSISGYLFTQPPHVLELNNIVSLRNNYRYIYRNPVSAKLCQKAEEYPFSTLGYVLGNGKLPFLCLDNMNLICNPHHVLSWINRESVEAESSIIW